VDWCGAPNATRACRAELCGRAQARLERTGESNEAKRRALPEGKPLPRRSRRIRPLQLALVHRAAPAVALHPACSALALPCRARRARTTLRVYARRAPSRDRPPPHGPGPGPPAPPARTTSSERARGRGRGRTHQRWRLESGSGRRGEWASGGGARSSSRVGVRRGRASVGAADGRRAGRGSLVLLWVVCGGALAEEGRAVKGELGGSGRGRETRATERTSERERHRPPRQLWSSAVSSTARRESSP